MTTPRPETLEREKDKLYLTDAELIRRLGVPADKFRQTVSFLEDKQGFPKKQAFWGGRRYWPAVKAFLDKMHGLNVADQTVPCAPGRTNYRAEYLKRKATR